MSYQITAGIPEEELPEFLEAAGKKFGRFADGRVDYTQADIAPAVMCTVTCGDEMLIAKRGYGLADAEGYWSTINGFIDEIKPVKDQAIQELREELGVEVEPRAIKVGPSHTLQSAAEKRQYIIFPCLVELDAKPKVVLDREHTDFAWIHRGELESYDILDDLPWVVDAALALRGSQG